MRWWSSALLAALAACRFGFDPATGDALGVGDAVAPPSDVVLIDGPAGSITSSWGEDTASQHRNVTRDTYLSSEVETIDYRTYNYGASTSLSIENSKHSLLRFDVSAIPSSATIVSASLRLALSGSSLHGTIDINRVLEDWDEGMLAGAAGTASWNNRKPGIAWATAGAGQPGSSDATSQGQIPAAALGVMDITIAAALVQGWIANPASNFGITFSLTSGDDCRFASREGADGSRPFLVVTYFP